MAPFKQILSGLPLLSPLLQIGGFVAPFKHSPFGKVVHIGGFVASFIQRPPEVVHIG